MYQHWHAALLPPCCLLAAPAGPKRVRLGRGWSGFHSGHWGPVQGWLGQGCMLPARAERLAWSAEHRLLLPDQTSCCSSRLTRSLAPCRAGQPHLSSRPASPLEQASLTSRAGQVQASLTSSRPGAGQPHLASMPCALRASGQARRGPGPQGARALGTQKGIGVGTPFAGRGGTVRLARGPEGPAAEGTERVLKGRYTHLVRVPAGPHGARCAAPGPVGSVGPVGPVGPPDACR
jgi:hypothetical protein